MKRARMVGILGIVGLALAASQASAAVILGGSLFVANDGNVVVTYQGSTAGYHNQLQLDSPANAWGVLFDNQTSAVSDCVDLGFFTAGTELIFRLDVITTGESFYSGPASRNADNLPHVRIDDAFSATEVLVEFEDLFGTPEFPGGFNDLGFSATNLIAAAPVPEPGTLAMFSAGLVGLVGMAWRRTRGK